VREHLHVHDDPAWRSADRYNPTLAEALRTAHRLIRGGRATVADYAEALDCLVPLRDSSMALPQRINFRYIEAQCLVAVGECLAALNVLDEALDLSVLLEDSLAFAEIAYLRGSVSGILLQFTDATTDHSLCIETLRELREEGGPLAPALQLHALLARVGAELNLAHWDTASQLLQESQSLLPHAPNRQREVATICWLQALLHRWTGALERGLTSAMQASDLLLQLGSSMAAGRIQRIAGDIALELAETFAAGPPPTSRDKLIDLAGPYIIEAVDAARAEGDIAGEGLALLTKVRYDRLARRNVPRLPVLEHVIAVALNTYDTALQGQAYIALSNELVARGEVERAKGAARAARNALAGTDNFALDGRAHRLLLRLSEMHV